MATMVDMTNDLGPAISLISTSLLRGDCLLRNTLSYLVCVAFMPIRHLALLLLSTCLSAVLFYMCLDFWLLPIHGWYYYCLVATNLYAAYGIYIYRTMIIHKA